VRTSDAQINETVALEISPVSVQYYNRVTIIATIVAQISYVARLLRSKV